MSRVHNSSNTAPPGLGDTKSPVFECGDCGRRRASGYELAAGADYPSGFVGVGCSCGNLADSGSHWEDYLQGTNGYQHSQPVWISSPPTVPAIPGDQVPWYLVPESMPLD